MTSVIFCVALRFPDLKLDRQIKELNIRKIIDNIKTFNNNLSYI